MPAQMPSVCHSRIKLNPSQELLRQRYGFNHFTEDSLPHWKMEEASAARSKNSFRWSANSAQTFAAQKWRLRNISTAKHVLTRAIEQLATAISAEIDEGCETETDPSSGVCRTA